MAKVWNAVWDAIVGSYTDAFGTTHYISSLYDLPVTKKYPNRRSQDEYVEHLPPKGPEWIERQSTKGYKPPRQGLGSSKQRPNRECFQQCTDLWNAMPQKCPPLAPCCNISSKEAVWNSKQDQGTLSSYVDHFIGCCMKTCEKGPRKEKDPTGSHYRQTLQSIKDRYNTMINGTKEYYRDKIKNVQDAQKRTLALIRLEFNAERKTLKTSYKTKLKLALKQGLAEALIVLDQWGNDKADINALELQRMTLRKIQYQQEIARWKETLNNAIAPLMDYRDNELAQYKASAKQDPDSFIHPDAHVSDCLPCFPCKPSCKESTLTILFTSQQMQVLEYQALSVHESLCDTPSPCCPDIQFNWSIISGGGELSSNFGQTVVYHAPPANYQCLQNPVILLFDCCGRQATVALSVNAVTDPNQLAFKSWTPDSGEICFQSGPTSCIAQCAQVYIDGWTCDGLFINHITNCTCGGGASWGGLCSDEWCAARLAECTCHSQAAAAAACGYSLPVDVRTEEQKALGCCPAAIELE